MKGKRRRISSSSSDDDSPHKLQKASEASSYQRAGRILKMTLKNFMCHTLLEVEFTGNVNFLTGNNGSGKSAILAALSLGLGCKAKSTNRGDISSIKAFIKFGCNSASIEIVLNNEGALAYKSDEYGSRITVCRTMSLAGSSTYRIKNVQGKTLSKKMKDLHDLTSVMNIQVDNPVCILSQDTARNFLNTTDPKIRYNLFFRATRLDHLSQLYAEAIRNKNSAEKEFVVKKGQETELMKKVKKIVSKIEQARKAESLREALNMLNNEKAWENTIISEQRFRKQEEDFNKLITELRNLEEVCEKHKKHVEKMQEEKGELETKLREVSEVMVESEKPVQDLLLKIRALEKEMKEKDSSITSTERLLAFRKQDLMGLHSLISNYNDRCSQIEREAQARHENLDSLGNQKKEKNNLLITYEDEFDKLSMHLKEKEGKMESIKQQLYAATNKINVLTDKLRTFQQDTNNPYAIYGPNFIRLINALESDVQNFTRPPIGPIGIQVAIKDKKWTLAVESYLKAGLLCSFLVNSQQDQNRLNQLVKRVWSSEGGGRPPSIIATKFVDKPHDVSKYLVANHPDCVRLYDVLSVQNPIVMNCLIDQANIESVLLIPEKKFGFSILKQQHTVPQNCRIAITPAGDTIHPDPNYKFYSGRQTNTKFIQVDTAEALRQCQATLAKENQVKNELRLRMQVARDELTSAAENLPTLKRNIANCRQILEGIARRINELQTQTIEAPGSVDDLKKEAGEIEKVIKQKSANVNETRIEIEELQMKLQDLKAELQQFDVVRRETRQMKEDLQDQVTTHSYKKQGLFNDYNKVKHRIENVQDNINKEREELNQLQQCWEQEYAETERQNGPKPDVIRRLDDIQSDINQLNMQIQDLAHYNLNNLLIELKRLEQRVDTHRDTMNSIEKTLIELRETKAGRKTKLLETKKVMKEYAIFNFKNFLHARNYQGNMAIDYDSETLEMVVMPHAGVLGVTPTSNLSGGERSFSTVAFLYALWKTLDFPFYILDEFDVYMDPQNRNLVIQILIDHAKKNKDAQYVFLTPQDISFIKDSDVAIHRLEDPERTQI